MKYLILSDIHGSSYFFEKAMLQYKKNNCDKILLLGDLLYHGPRNNLPYGHDVKKLIDLLNSYKNDIICVKGNCDSEVDQMVLEFNINESAYVNNNNLDVYLTHGHKYNPSMPMNVKKGSLVLYGHTHIHNFEIVDEVYYFNPGSLSLPKNNQVNSFAILEDNELSLFDIDGNLLNKYEL